MVWRDTGQSKRSPVREVVRRAGRWRLAACCLAGTLFGLSAEASITVSSSHVSPRNASRSIRSSTRYIILHTTEGAARGALEKLSRNGECHYAVDTDGTIYRIIDRRRVAFHCGRSMWDGATDLDSMSIGIEIVGYHDRDLTHAQYRALRMLLDDLKRSYHMADDRVLTHSMVAYGTPNRWQPRNHRGRKRCAMLLAQPANRRRLGLMSRPAFDPDLRAGRLADADPELTRILYAHDGGGTPSSPRVIGPGRTAWDIARDLYNADTTLYIFPDGRRRSGSQITNWRAIPPGTQVLVGQASAENPVDGLLVIGTDGASARELAGEEAHAEGTFYFLPGQDYRRGSDLTPEHVRALPRGTRVLVGYAVGGPIASDRPAFAVCGVRWNRSDTFYLTPRGELVGGDVVNERSIPRGAMVFYRK